MIMSLFKDYRPLALFSWVALLFCALGLLTGVPVIVEFAQTGFVPKLPPRCWPWRSFSWASSHSQAGLSWTRWSRATARSTSCR